MIRVGSLQLSPASYVPSELHSSRRIWRETNCYTDLLIEVLHALGLEVEAGLGFTIAAAFEADQWTFFKPPHADLDALFGVEIQELSFWATPLDHIERQLELGRLVVPEVDAFHLPDVAGSDYRTAHVKTAIAIAGMDRAARRLEYFHNAGFFELEGDDFDGLFGAAGERPDQALPPYTEFVKLERVRRRPGSELVEEALRIARLHVARIPAANPFEPFGRRLVRDLSDMGPTNASGYNAYMFATVRQCGSAFELAAEHLRWLGRHGVSGLDQADDAFTAIAQTAQVLVLKCARAVRSGRTDGLADDVRQMAEAWDRSTTTLAQRLAT